MPSYYVPTYDKRIYIFRYTNKINDYCIITKIFIENNWIQLCLLYLIIDIISLIIEMGDHNNNSLICRKLIIQKDIYLVE